MIYKIKKDDCYKISGSLVLNNRYTKVTGKSFSSGYMQKTLGNEYVNTTAEDETYFVHDNTATWKVGNYWTQFAFKYYYKQYDLGTLTSSTIMDLNSSSFSTKITYDGGLKEAINSTKPSTPGPSSYIKYDYTSSPGLQLDATLNACKSLLGNCSVQYNDLTLYSVSPILKVVYKIELMWGMSSDKNNIPVPDQIAGTVKMDTEVQYNIVSTNLYQTSNEFGLGVDDFVQTFRLSNNVLFDIDSKQNNDLLIEAVANTILNNYKKGKQVVKITCPMLDIQDVDGNKYINHLFEQGQYFYILDEIGTSLFNYKLTNVPKIFEIISAEYVHEVWNLILKEVARVESN